jgi:hypothetical protein
VSKQKRGKRFWRITMLLHGKEKLIAEIPTTHITERQLENLLTTLFAKHTLSDLEIVDTHRRANTKGYRNMMPVIWQRTKLNTVIVQDGSNWVQAQLVVSD